MLTFTCLVMLAAVAGAVIGVVAAAWWLGRRVDAVEMRVLHLETYERWPSTMSASRN